MKLFTTKTPNNQTKPESTHQEGNHTRLKYTRRSQRTVH